MEMPGRQGGGGSEDRAGSIELRRKEERREARVSQE